MTPELWEVYFELSVETQDKLADQIMNLIQVTDLGIEGACEVVLKTYLYLFKKGLR